MAEIGKGGGGALIEGIRRASARQESAREEVDRLLREGADPNARDKSGRTALGWAIQRGDSGAARRLLEGGADPRAQDAHGPRWEPLHWAARSGEAALILDLLEGGASAQARDADGWAPLHLAAVNGEWEAARLLLEAGADPQARDEEGRTALEEAWENAPALAAKLEGYLRERAAREEEERLEGAAGPARASSPRRGV